MRSSKSRSRSKSNRPRTLGNVTNRVFESSGPDGKVRGTPQQIVDKYQVLARDAQLSNDRVAAENFLQHAEHYTRMLAEAQREQVAEQEARRLQDMQNQQSQNQQRDRNDRNDRGEAAGQQADQRDSGRNDNRSDQRGEDRRDRPHGQQERESRPAANEVIDLAGAEDDNGLVETPEARRPPRSRQPRAKPVVAAESCETVDPAPAPAADAAADDGGAETAKAGAEAPKRAPRRPRVPRKPKADDTSEAAE